MNVEGFDYSTKKHRSKCHSSFNPIEIKNHHIRLVIPNINCNAIFYISNGDRPAQKVPIRLVYNFDIPLLNDHFTVQCEDENKRKFYPKLPYASIHYNTPTRQRLAQFSKEDDDFDVLVLGFDSISNLQFQRMLPNSYEYLSKNLDATILQGLFESNGKK